MVAAAQWWWQLLLTASMGFTDLAERVALRLAQGLHSCHIAAALRTPASHPLACVCVLLQDTEGKKREKAERLRFGRFFYRFPNGESGADVYDRCGVAAAGTGTCLAPSCQASIV